MATTEALGRYTLVEVRKSDCTPVDVRDFADLDAALDARDQYRKEWPSTIRFYGVCDRDDEERGWLDWDAREFDGEAVA